MPGLTGNPLDTTVGCGAAEQAKASNVKVSVQGAPELDVSKQTQLINALTASKPDAIMISIIDPKAMIPPLAQAKAAGIKIIAIDGDVSDDSIMATNIGFAPIVEALEDKTLDGTVVQHPYGEDQLGIKSAVAAIDGDEVQRRHGTPFVIATPDNVQDAKVQKFIYKTHC